MVVPPRDSTAVLTGYSSLPPGRGSMTTGGDLPDPPAGPAHPDARPRGSLADLNIVGKFGDDREAEALRLARVGDLHLEAAGLVGQRDPHRLGRAVQPVCLHRPRARLTDRQPDLVQHVLRDTAAPGYRCGHQARGAYVRGQGREADFDCGHPRVRGQPAATSRTFLP